jgi:ribonucleoside-diphosphate reductase alpha chain
MITDYQKYIHKSRYARWREEDKRRETWDETVARYLDFFTARTMDVPEYTSRVESLRDSITNLEVMPSMRCLMSAGKALDRDHVAGYNCAYMPIDHPRSFDETMYILLCGTGVGFSVERQFVQKLPEVAEEMFDTDTTIKVADSKIGWASALRELISLLYSGKCPQWDMSKVRPAGSRLHTFGGRASGPEPLNRLFANAVRIFKGAKGRKLTSLECHDLVCYIADTVVVGGVRRSACISLSNLSDDRMRSAKYGEWYHDSPQRALANNSVAYTEKPDFRSFLREWETLYKSKAGERGVVNREAFKKKCAKIGREKDYDFGTNPCGEIILRPNQFCNLTELIVRPEDTLETLRVKVRTTTILGTLQATLTDFRYLRPIWKKNTEEEALLGVSLTGIMDHPIMSGRSGEETLIEWVTILRQTAKETNEEWARILGINPAAAITCVSD